MNVGFWVVWCPTHGAPKVRHDMEFSAIAEARRLAEANPDREFFVLQATHSVTKPTVVVSKLSEPLPF